MVSVAKIFTRIGSAIGRVLLRSKPIDAPKAVHVGIPGTAVAGFAMRLPLSEVGIEPIVEPAAEPVAAATVANVIAVDFMLSCRLASVARLNTKIGRSPRKALGQLSASPVPA